MYFGRDSSCCRLQSLGKQILKWRCKVAVSHTKRQVGHLPVVIELTPQHTPGVKNSLARPQRTLLGMESGKLLVRACKNQQVGLPYAVLDSRSVTDFIPQLPTGIGG